MAAHTATHCSQRPCENGKWAALHAHETTTQPGLGFTKDKQWTLLHHQDKVTPIEQRVRRGRMTAMNDASLV